MSKKSDAVASISNDKHTGAPMTDKLARAAHSVIDDTAAKADTVEQQLREQAAKAGEKLESSHEAASEQVERSMAKVESFVRGRPVAAAGIAFAAGVLATALMRR